MADQNNKDENHRVPKMFKVPWKDDQTQKIEQYPDGTIHRRITTDEKETSQIWHSTGAYTEIRPDGSRIDVTSNNGMSYSKGGTTMSVDNNGDIRLSGSKRVNVDVDSHVTFAKDLTVMGGGAIAMNAQGGLKMNGSSVGISSAGGEVTINSDRSVAIKSANKTSIHSEGATTMTTGKGDVHIASGGEMDFNSKGNASMKTNGKMTMASQGGTKMTSKGVMTVGGSSSNFTSDGGTSVSGSNITVGSGQTNPDSAQFAGGGAGTGGTENASV